MARAELTMQSAIEYLGLSHQFPPRAGSGNYMCPICGEPAKPRKKKLNINFQNNTFRCPRCDFKGGPFQFWAHFRNLPTTGPDWAKEVAKDFYSVADGSGKEVKRRAEEKRFERIDVDRLDTDHVDLVYRAFLKRLTLNEKHKENLRQRGLSDDQIRRGGYRSLPENGVDGICRELEAEGVKLIGVPGFYTESNKTRFVQYGKGYLIPCMSVKGKIVGIQLRLEDAKKGEKRYFTISSAGKLNGAKGVANPHYTRGREDALIITEGPLKGNIISAFTGYSCLSVLGVNSISKVPEDIRFLKGKGLKEIKIAYDMDMLTNEHVLTALVHLEEMIAKEGVAYSRLTWDPGEPDENGELPRKGLDDYLLAMKKLKGEA